MFLVVSYSYIAKTDLLRKATRNYDSGSRFIQCINKARMYLRLHRSRISADILLSSTHVFRTFSF